MPDATLSVEPGSTVSTTVTVYNASAIVEEYTIEVLGPCAEFAQAMPDRVSLMPGDDTTVEVMFSPPAGAATEAGTLPFGVRAVSGVDDYYAAVAEGTVDLGAVHDLEARLVAVTGEHRWVGRYRAEFTNNGTAAVTVDLAVLSDTEDLGFALAPTRFVLDRGDTDAAFLKVRPSAPFFMGAPRRHTFQLAYQRHSEHDSAVDPTSEGTLDGVFEQRPVASRRLLTIAGLAVAGLIALIMLLPSPAPPEPADVPPPTPEIQSIQPAAADALLITWVGDPNATGYRIDRLLTQDGQQQVVDSASVGAERTAHRFEGLEPETDHCFQLVALNDAGPSDPTPAACGRTLAAAPSAAASAPAAGQSEGAGGQGGGAGQSEGAGGQGGGAGQSEGAGGQGGGAGQSEGAGGQIPEGVQVEPQGAYVIYGSFPLNDPAQRNAALQLLASLQSAGVQAQMVDSRQSDTFADGLNDVGVDVVFQDGFASQTEAIAECNQRRQLAEFCAAFPPRN